MTLFERCHLCAKAKLQLQQQKQSATLPEQVRQLEQRIVYTDEKINEKVYVLYGLSEEEVGVVEGR